MPKINIYLSLFFPYLQYCRLYNNGVISNTYVSLATLRVGRRDNPTLNDKQLFRAPGTGALGALSNNKEPNAS